MVPGTSALQKCRKIPGYTIWSQPQWSLCLSTLRQEWWRNSTEAAGWKDYLPEFAKDIGYNVDEKFYSILYGFGWGALAYRSDKLTAEETSSYSIITDPRITGKVGAQDWWGNSLGPLSIMAGYGPTLGRNPYRLNNEEFAKFGVFLKKLRPQFSGFYEIAGIFTALANGTMWLYPGGGDWAVQLLKDQGVGQPDLRRLDRAT